MREGDAVLARSRSWSVDAYRQCLWEFFLAGIFYNQSVIPWSLHPRSQLNADLQERQSLTALDMNADSLYGFSRRPYIEAAADGHVRMARGDSLCGTGAWQVVVVAAAGIVGRDGGEGVQRQVAVQQTAAWMDKHTGQTNRTSRD